MLFLSAIIRFQIQPLLLLQAANENQKPSLVILLIKSARAIQFSLLNYIKKVVKISQKLQMQQLYPADSSKMNHIQCLKKNFGNLNCLNQIKG